MSASQSADKREGKILAGVLAPHPPHLVYADRAPQNAEHGVCGWEELRWGYERCRKNVLALKPDVLLVHTPHWQTIVGHHVLGLPRFKGLSVDPIFPHIFRYRFDLPVDVDLSLAIAQESRDLGLISKVMRNPNFRIDYGSITSLHLMSPAWDIPVVILSSNNSPYYFSDRIGMEEMTKLGEATKRAIHKSGKRAVLLASNSLSHRHFTSEPPTIEDMSQEHVFAHEPYVWDMRMLQLMREGKTEPLLALLPDYIEATYAEIKAGGLVWMLAALGFPNRPATVHAYGSVIGTGNAVVEWPGEEP